MIKPMPLCLELCLAHDKHYCFIVVPTKILKERLQKIGKVVPIRSIKFEAWPNCEIEKIDFFLHFLICPCP